MVKSAADKIKYFRERCASIRLFRSADGHIGQAYFEAKQYEPAGSDAGESSGTPSFGRQANSCWDVRALSRANSKGVKPVYCIGCTCSLPEVKTILVWRKRGAASIPAVMHCRKRGHRPWRPRLSLSPGGGLRKAMRRHRARAARFLIIESR